MNSRGTAWIAAAALSLGVGTAMADIVTPIGTNGQLILSLSSSTNQMGTVLPGTITGDGSLTDNTGPVQISDLTGNPASNYGFGNSFGNLNNGFFGTITVNGTPQEYNFVDSYVIDIPTSTASAFAFSLNLSSQLGIDNLSARLYAYTANSNSNLTVGATGPFPGVVPGGSWSTNTMSGGVDSTGLNLPSVNGGVYVLQIVGEETGTVSGMYSGSLAVTPVPLPAGLPLLLSGLGALAATCRRAYARRYPAWEPVSA
jgi:hypothetical protein